MRYDTTRPINLDDLIHERQEAARRPRPTLGEVLAQWVQNAGGGVGVGLVVAVALWVAGAPEAWLWQGPIACGLLTFAGLMAWRAGLDESLDARKVAQAKRQMDQRIAAAETQTKATRRQLEVAYDEIEALEKSVDRLTYERDSALTEASRTRESVANKQRSTFTPATNVAPNAINDAYAMLHYRFDHNRYLSRRRAEDELSWTQERHRAAQQLLLDAGIAEIVGTQPRMVVATLDAALTQLGSFIVRAGMAPQMPQERGWNDV
jgi:3-phenylpropionate/cinnamic acid dioxygenase small subunit